MGWFPKVKMEGEAVLNAKSSNMTASLKLRVVGKGSDGAEFELKPLNDQAKRFLYRPVATTLEPKLEGHQVMIPNIPFELRLA